MLVEYNGVKKLIPIEENMKEKTDFVDIFKSIMDMAKSEISYISLQRYDHEWDDFIDIEVKDIQNKDKLKIKIFNNECNKPAFTSEKSVNVATEQLISNLQSEQEALQFRLNIAQAKVSSLKEVPKPRMPLGKNVSFTCSRCHFNGHRVSSCMQPPCCGFEECGNRALHKEYRDKLKQVSLFYLGYECDCY